MRILAKLSARFNDGTLLSQTTLSKRLSDVVKEAGDGCQCRTEDCARDRGRRRDLICCLPGGERVCAARSRALHYRHRVADAAAAAIAYAEAHRIGNHPHRHRGVRPCVRIADCLGFWPGRTRGHERCGALSGALRQPGDLARPSWRLGRWPLGEHFMSGGCCARHSV